MRFLLKIRANEREEAAGRSVAAGLGLRTVAAVIILTALLLASAFSLVSCTGLKPAGGDAGKQSPAEPPSQGNPPASGKPKTPAKTPPLKQPAGSTVAARFDPPEGYVRESVVPDSFAHFLRNLAVKPDGSDVKYFDGRTKTRYVHEAVLDIDIGARDLQQCADAIMRLRAEYLFAQKRYPEISFNFASGFKCDYQTWSQGNRVVLDGNRARWVKSAAPSSAYADFRKYLDVVFTYANTTSLAGQMNRVPVASMAIGDAFIDQGHAIIVLDMAVNKSNNKKLFMLAQSYMPAQNIEILKNPKNSDISPWYELDFGENLETPEWRFTSNDLKRFK